MANTESYDVVVIGGTPGGIASAVRSAREGCKTCLVTYRDHLGGMMASGLSYTDTLTMKQRSPIFEEFVQSVREHYHDEYGSDSRQYEYSENGYIFEPHVAETIFDNLVESEPDLAVKSMYYPTTATRSNCHLRTVTIESFDDDTTVTLEATTFVEGTYEGDLAATAGVPYRIGRESREEHGEQFAGRLFTQVRGDKYYPREAVGNVNNDAPPDRRGPLDTPVEKRQGELDLIPHPAGLTEIFPRSTGEGDDAIQAYNYRLCLTNNPDNRRYPEKPDVYDRSEYLAALDAIENDGFRSYFRLRYLPNEKADMNTANLPGENHDYPESGWEKRNEIATRNRNYALGLLYFLQNDDAVPADIQQSVREWGLATDEFTDNDNFPWQLYVREARRLEGRYMFTEADGRYAKGIERAPINHDAIAIAEYPLDSHGCTSEKQLGSGRDGNFYASQITRPAQVPYRSILPIGLDNLLVPVPLSATHVAFGMIRLEPTWMHIGEAAGFAAALALERNTPPATLDITVLQRTLVEHGTMLSFFNEFDMDTQDTWTEPIQFLGTKGFFNSYNATPDKPLSKSAAKHWARSLATLIDGELENPTARARRLPSEETSNQPITGVEFIELFKSELKRSDINPDRVQSDKQSEEPISYGTAAIIVYDILSQ